MFKSSIEKAFMAEQAKFKGQENYQSIMFQGDHDILGQIESTYKEIQIEMNKLHTEKALIQSEEKIRYEVKRQLSAYTNTNEEDPEVGRAFIA